MQRQAGGQAGQMPMPWQAGGQAAAPQLLPGQALPTVLMLSLKVWPSPLTRREMPSKADRSSSWGTVRAPQKPPPSMISSPAGGHGRGVG